MATLPHEVGHIGEMMDRLGIDAAERVVPALSLTFMTAFRRCETCQAKATCQAWLSQHHEPQTLAPAFCPNRDVLFELQVSHPSARH